MSKEMRKGSAFESDVVSYMREALGDGRIERRAKNGVKDRGDVTGVFLRGLRCVIECKNAKRMELAKWIDEAEVEKGNDGAEFAFVAHKRKGKGRANMGETYVTMKLSTLCAIIAGSHDLLE